MNRKMIMAVHMTGPIAVGALIYGMASPDVIFIKKASDFIGKTIQIPVFSADDVFLRLVRNYVPDMMQKASFVPGTFDVFDIFAEFFAETAAACMIHQLYSREEF